MKFQTVMEVGKKSTFISIGLWKVYAYTGIAARIRRKKFQPRVIFSSIKHS